MVNEKNVIRIDGQEPGFDTCVMLGVQHLEAARGYFERARKIMRPGIDRLPSAAYPKVDPHKE